TSPGKIAHFFRQASSESENALERQVFTERDKMNLVVTCSPLSCRTYKTGGVINLSGLLRSLARVPGSKVTDQQPCVCAASHLTDRAAKEGIAAIKRGRRFRPNDQLRRNMLSIRRLQAQIHQLVQRLFEVIPRPIRTLHDGNILLDQPRHMI